MRINDGFALREVAGEQVIMPCGKNISTFDGAVALNETAAFIFSVIESDPGIGKDAVADRITEEYNVEKKEAAADLENVLKDLIRYGIVSEN